MRPRSCESPARASGWGHACSGSPATCPSGPRAGLGPEKGQHPSMPHENLRSMSQPWGSWYTEPPLRTSAIRTWQVPADA